MSIIKQIGVYNGDSWVKDDIGANAANVSLSTNAAGGSNVQTALNNLVGTAKITASRALIAGSDNKITASAVTSTELGYLSGVTSAIQSQIDGIKTDIGQGDISSIGDGTITGAINSLNTNLGNKVDTSALSGYVPTSRTVNSKALTGNISLTASDVGAAPSSLSTTVNNLSTTVSGKVSKSGDSMTGHLTLASSTGNAKIFARDSVNNSYSLIGDNGTNLWIGAGAAASTHHKGRTIISSGHSGSVGYNSIQVCVPNAANNNGTSYDVIHTNYQILQVKSYQKTYTVAANGTIDLTASQFGFSVPSGYQAVSITFVTFSSSGVVLRGIKPRASGSDWALVGRNVTSSSISSTAHISVLYCRSGMV